MLSITSGRRATIEMTSRRRAPGAEASEDMGDGTVHWCRWKIQFRGLGRDQSAARAAALGARDGGATLGAQIEDQLRRAIRDGALKPGARVPSTRDLARQLGVSRRVAVDAYGQLAAEGYLSLRQGARPRVVRRGGGARPRRRRGRAAAPAAPAAPRFDFRPSVPDVSTFPRAAWLRALREALATMPDADLQYGDPRGVERAARGARRTTSAASAASSPTPRASS